MAEKLKQCPFCGSDAKYNEKLEAVFCHGCDAMRTGYKHKKGSAILEWNRRPQIKEKNLNSAGIDTCPCCGGSVKVLERSLEHWGGMKCESISLSCGETNKQSTPCKKMISCGLLYDSELCDNGFRECYE